MGLRSIMIPQKPTEEKTYEPQDMPTIMQFHESDAQIRAIVGPVGSGKTSAASWEIGYYLPKHLKKKFGIRKTRWIVVRNTYPQLIDSTMNTFMEWFSQGHPEKQHKRYTIRLPKPDSDCTVEIWYRSCDRPEDAKNLGSYEATGYWIDEAIEVPEQIKRMLKNRIGRYPQGCPVRYGIETTNPPDTDHPMYSQFQWNVTPPGPMPTGVPLLNHEGYWQPPYENIAHLPVGYYDNLRTDYANEPDWIERYIEGRPGIMIVGQSVYGGFKRDHHVAPERLIWDHQKLYRGWDNSGNCPACVVVMVPAPLQAHVLREFHTDRDDIVTFGNRVVNMCNMDFPGAEFEDWGDPAGEFKYSRKEGGFTSNAELLRNECGVDIMPSEQNLDARIVSVQNQIRRIDGLLIDPSCSRLINGFMGGYCYPEHKSIHGELSPNILKNKFSHIHESLQYIFVQLFPSLPPSLRGDRSRRKRVTQVDTSNVMRW